MLPAAMCWANALLKARVSLPCLGPPSAQPSETNLLVPGYALSTLPKRLETKTPTPFFFFF